MTATIWHNPRCSKSRQTLSLLQENGIEPEVRLYLQNVPSEEELRAALAELGLTAFAIIRKGEGAYKELSLGPESDEATLIAAMAKHPKLIERPIVFNNGQATIGRPPEAAMEIF